MINFSSKTISLILKWTLVAAALCLLIFIRFTRKENKVFFGAGDSKSKLSQGNACINAQDEIKQNHSGYLFAGCIGFF